MNKALTLSSKTCYNINEKQCLTETILPVYFVSNAKRAKQTTNNRRRREPHPLWWNLSNTAVLQKTANQETFAKEINISPTFRTISSNGPNFNDYLCHNSWHQSFEQDKDITAKRRISENNWTQKLSLCQQFAEISKTFRFKDHSRHQQDSRSVTVEDVLSSPTADKYSFRFRFDSSHSLRQTDRRSQSWIQSRQKGETFLSPVSLLRVLHQRLLARGLTTGKCLYSYRRSRVSAGMSAKSSAIYLPHQSACGFGILRPQVYRTFRREKHWLCHRSQTDWRHQEKTSWFTLSPVQERLVSCRIPAYANEMEESPSLYCHSQKTSRQTSGATNFVYPGTIFLPDIRYQSAFGCSQYLVFLQRPSLDRNTYQRTETRFLFNQDTNEQLFGKSNLFYFASAGLQHHQLVQTSLSARTIKKLNLGYNPYGYFSVSSQTDKAWKQECSQTSSSPVSVKATTEFHTPENRKVKDQLNITSLLNFQNRVPSQHYKIYAFSRFF